MGDEDWEYDMDEGDVGGDGLARMDDAFRRRGKVAPTLRRTAGMRAPLQLSALHGSSTA